MAATFAAIVTAGGIFTPRAVAAQTASSAAPIELFTMSVGRALPLDFTAPVTLVTVANPNVADAVVLTATSVVVNAKAIGETDILLSGPALGVDAKEVVHRG